MELLKLVDADKVKELEELGYEVGITLNELINKYPEYKYDIIIFILLLSYNIII
jgi:hypothetical protein